MEVDALKLEFEDLQLEHLRERWYMEAIARVGNEEEVRRVWTRRRLPPFSGQNHPGTLITGLRVRVPSLDERGIRPLEEKIESFQDAIERAARAA
jgi:hypothetical protein